MKNSFFTYLNFFNKFCLKKVKKVKAKLILLLKNLIKS